MPCEVSSGVVVYHTRGVHITSRRFSSSSTRLAIVCPARVLNRGTKTCPRWSVKKLREMCPPAEPIRTDRCSPVRTSYWYRTWPNSPQGVNVAPRAGHRDQPLGGGEDVLPALLRQAQPPQVAAPRRQLAAVGLLPLLVHRGEVQTAVLAADDLRVDLPLRLAGPQFAGAAQLAD